MSGGNEKEEVEKIGLTAVRRFCRRFQVETATFLLSNTATFVINIGNDNSQQHEILGSILMGWPGKVFSTKSVKYGKRL